MIVGAKVDFFNKNSQTCKTENPLAFAIPDIAIIICLFVTACINGITVGILWTASNHYIASSASDANKGFFFSYFWTFYMSS